MKILSNLDFSSSPPGLFLNVGIEIVLNNGLLSISLGTKNLIHISLQISNNSKFHWILKILLLEISFSKPLVNVKYLNSLNKK
jgi:hypothetical protein